MLGSRGTPLRSEFVQAGANGAERGVIGWRRVLLQVVAPRECGFIRLAAASKLSSWRDPAYLISAWQVLTSPTLLSITVAESCGTTLRTELAQASSGKASAFTGWRWHSSGCLILSLRGTTAGGPYASGCCHSG